MITTFDIGGSAIKSASVLGYNDITPISTAPTPPDDFEAFVAVMRNMIDQSPHPTHAVAASITGIINKTTGIAKAANVPCINKRHLENDLQNKLGIPVLVANDADCFALAEANFGVGKDHQNVFGIILGTGVGGGVVVKRELLASAEGFAGEWGHGPSISTSTPFWPSTIPNFLCGCGQLGCADTIGGARGMEHLHTFLHGEKLRSIDITQNWLSGDKNADTTIHVLVDLISGPLAMILNVLGITYAPVGGGLSNVPQLIDLLDVATRKKMLADPGHPIIVCGQSEIAPGLAGAAILGLQNYETRFSFSSKI